MLSLKALITVSNIKKLLNEHNYITVNIVGIAVKLGA